MRGVSKEGRTGVVDGRRLNGCGRGGKGQRGGKRGGGERRGGVEGGVIEGMRRVEGEGGRDRRG